MSRRFVFVMLVVVLFSFLSVFVGAVESQANELPLLTKPGPYGVTVKGLTFDDPSRENWKLDTLVWYPADKTSATPPRGNSLIMRNASPDRSGAPYPLIIYSHGWTGMSGELGGVMEQLASKGYVVAAPHHHDTEPHQFELVDRPLDIMLVLNQLAAITEGDLAGMIDTSNVGLMGYSLGGDAVLQMLGLLRDPVNYRNWCAEHPDLKSTDCNDPTSAGNWDFDAIAAYRAQLGLQDMPDGRWAPFGDPRIHAVLALAPGDFPLTTEDMLAAVTTPTMILHGTKDQYCDYEGNAVRTYMGMGIPDRYLISFINTDHGTFMRQEIPQHFATAFFGFYLKSDEAFAPYLTPEHLPAWPNPKMVWGPYEGE